MEEAEDTVIDIGSEDDTENSDSDNGEIQNDEHENNENTDSEEDSGGEEADISNYEGNASCNSERCGEDSNYEILSTGDTRPVSLQVEHEHVDVEVNIESTSKGKDLIHKRKQYSSSPTHQSSNAQTRNGLTKHKGKGKAANAGNRNWQTQGQSSNLSSKRNVNNQEATNFKGKNSKDCKNVLNPSQQNTPYSNSSNGKGGNDQNWRKKSSNNPNQNPNKSISCSSSGEGKNSSLGNSTNSVSKGQNNNKSNNSYNNHKNNNSSTSNSSNNSNKNNNNNNNNSSKNNNNSNKNSNSDANNKKKSDSYSLTSKNILEEAKGVVKKIMKRKICAQPLDSPILRLHYRFSVLLFVLLYTIIQGCWVWNESIICIDGHNADAEVPYRIKNYCLSYPFVYDNSSEQEGHRRYILFYRWTHHSFLIISFVFYTPRILAKTKDNPRLKQLLHDLALGEHRYDGSTWEQDTNMMLKYMNYHEHTHGYLYFWLIICHLVALAIDCLIVLYLDYMIQGRFMNLVYSAYPLQRDPHYFTDELSRTFPPFVRCSVEEHVYINNARDQLYGCHLLWMDIYDKMFVFIWLWMAFLIVITLVSVFGLILWVIPPFNRLFLLIHTGSRHAKNLRDKIIKKYSFTDLYVLHLIKSHRSEAEFVQLMSGLVHLKKSTDTVMECKPKKSKVSFQDEVT